VVLVGSHNGSDMEVSHAGAGHEARKGFTRNSVGPWRAEHRWKRIEKTSREHLGKNQRGPFFSGSFVSPLRCGSCASDFS
jgi:hypothetical protein